jgi:hypothetical protein
MLMYKSALDRTNQQYRHYNAVTQSLVLTEVTISRHIMRMLHAVMTSFREFP